jgi:general secretion pathway protein G
MGLTAIDSLQRGPLAVNSRRPASAFTLIEMLIVVVIVAVLAAIVVPQFWVSTDGAKESSLHHNLHILQSQLELYRMDHLGRYPTIQNNSLPQLTKPTNTAGEIGAAGPQYRFGPYIVVLPLNAYDNSDKVTAVATPGEEPSEVSGTLGGWQYDETNGTIWPNNPESFK